MNVFLIDRLDQKGLRFEDVPLQTVADQFNTPTYVYSKAALVQNWRMLDKALQGHEHLICYAVKSCSNIAVLQLLTKLGSGFDIVSGGELERVRRAGGDLSKAVFSGVAKLPHEIEAALRSNILCLNIESSSELSLIERIAADLKCIAPVAVRVNPDVALDMHGYISTGCGESKFGVSPYEARVLYRQIAQSSVLKAVGISCHIGSQITTTEPYSCAAKQLVELGDELVAGGLPLQHIDFGGGFAVVDHSLDDIPSTDKYMQVFTKAIGNRPWKIIIEPGRAISGEAGLLLTRVRVIKQNKEKNFAIVDAAMNDLIRPPLYQAKHLVTLVHRNRMFIPTILWDIVGPICENGDFIALDRFLRIREGDLLAILGAGAYGFSMSSNYNSRPRAAEVLIDGKRMALIRKRETTTNLTDAEYLTDS